MPRADHADQPGRRPALHARAASTARRLSVAITAIGIVLMAGKIHADSEPGALPLLLFVTGVAGFVLARWRERRGRR